MGKYEPGSVGSENCCDGGSVTNNTNSGSGTIVHGHLSNGGGLLLSHSHHPGSVDLSPDDGDDDSSSNNLASECMDSDEEGEDGQRVIFPWMKKIHVAGVGKNKLQSFFFVLSHYQV